MFTGGAGDWVCFHSAQHPCSVVRVVGGSTEAGMCRALLHSGGLVEGVSTDVFPSPHALPAPVLLGF